MSTFYLDGDTEREIREALRRGAKLEALAGKLRTSPETLASVLGLHQSKPDEQQAATAVDLWALDALEAVL